MTKEEKNEFKAKLWEEIAAGDITPEQAESEWDFAVNGMDSYQSIYG